ncbi:MAG: hypothetical protein AB8G95_19600 [Anaerolineae bacterium]
MTNCQNMSRAVYVTLWMIAFCCVATACQPSNVQDLSSIQVTPPATRTPAPTPTEVKAFPTSVDKTRVPSNSSSKKSEALDKQTISLIAQLDRIYSRLTGLDEFDLNSDIVSRLDAPIQKAIADLRAIPARGGSVAEAEAAYADAIQELSELAKVPQSQTLLGTLAEIGSEMSSVTTAPLADALETGDVDGISAGIEQLGEAVTSADEPISAEEVSNIAQDLLNAANGLSGTGALVEELLPENGAEVGIEIAQKLALAASAIETGRSTDLLARLAEIKEIIDAISANLQLAQLFSLTVDAVEKETVAIQGVESLLGSGDNLRITTLSIQILETSVETGLSADIMPALSPAETSGLLCVLGTDYNISCLDEQSNWFIPETLLPYSGRMSALTACGEQFVIATDKELIYFSTGDATPFATTEYPFKAPNHLTCDSQGRIWALPSDNLADNPWFFDGETWRTHPTVLQNTISTHAFDAAWGTKWEANENSVVKDGKLIDPIPFMSRQLGQDWDIYYSLDWEMGIWGVASDEQGGMWFPGSALYYVSSNQKWYGYEGQIGPAFALMPNGLIIGAGPDPGTVRVFDKASTWWQLSDWPEGFQPDLMTIDGRGRIWAAGEDGIIVWNGQAWEALPPTVTAPVTVALIGAGPNLAP